MLWVLARLFCFACDTGFGEVDFAGGLRNGLKVWGGIGCEVWGMPMLAARWCLRCSQLATSSQKHVRHSMYSILHTCVQPCERIYVCVCCLPERSARGECSCVSQVKMMYCLLQKIVKWQHRGRRDTNRQNFCCLRVGVKISSRW